jgi:hypothetical protein
MAKRRLGRRSGLHTGQEVPVERRRWMRGWQNVMPLPRFEAALARLVREKILSPTKGEDGGRWYAAATELHETAA